jgi:negative regulator of sigma E activity
VQPAGKGGSLSGVSRLGPANAVGRIVGEHEVVVVGEVPTKTLNWFAENIVSATP